MLVAVELEAVGIRTQRAGLYAQQRIVSSVVDLVGVVAVVRGEDRGTDLLCDLEQLRIGTDLFGDAVVLQLDKEVVAAKDVLEATRSLDRFVEIATE